MCVVARFPEWVIFNALFTLLAPHLPDRTKLPKLSMVLMFLMKLCLTLFDEDLVQQFGIHSSTVSRNFY